jgi:hypothetical protein
MANQVAQNSITKTFFPISRSKFMGSPAVQEINNSEDSSIFRL